MSTMTTGQADEGLTRCANPCWLLIDADGCAHEGEEGPMHWLTEAAALEQAAQVVADAEVDARPDADGVIDLAAVEDLTRARSLRPSQQAFTCYVGPDCTECGGTYDEWCDSSVHVEGTTPESAEDDVMSSDWRRRASDREWLCGDCTAGQDLLPRRPLAAPDEDGQGDTWEHEPFSRP